MPILIGWHFIFLVNSACHLWGRQPYDAGKGRALLATANSLVQRYSARHRLCDVCFDTMSTIK